MLTALAKIYRGLAQEHVLPVGAQLALNWRSTRPLSAEAGLDLFVLRKKRGRHVLAESFEKL